MTLVDAIAGLSSNRSSDADGTDVEDVDERSFHPHLLAKLESNLSREKAKKMGTPEDPRSAASPTATAAIPATVSAATRRPTVAAFAATLAATTLALAAPRPRPCNPHPLHRHPGLSPPPSVCSGHGALC